MQLGFLTGCSGYLLPKPEDPELDRHKEEVSCSGW